jgi:hypothetical protein
MRSARDACVVPALIFLWPFSSGSLASSSYTSFKPVARAHFAELAGGVDVAVGDFSAVGILPEDAHAANLLCEASVSPLMHAINICNINV